MKKTKKRIIKRNEDGRTPWCEPCQSWHAKPLSKAHHEALRCFAPWKEGS